MRGRPLQSNISIHLESFPATRRPGEIEAPLRRSRQAPRLGVFPISYSPMSRGRRIEPDFRVCPGEAPHQGVDRRDGRQRLRRGSSPSAALARGTASVAASMRGRTPWWRRMTRPICRSRRRRGWSMQFDRTSACVIPRRLNPRHARRLRRWRGPTGFWSCCRLERRPSACCTNWRRR
jgi:hypothetical protein